MKQYIPKNIKTGKGLLFGIAPETKGGTKFAVDKVNQCTILGILDSLAGTT